ncbi:Peptidoglycan/LPS O-acetylase OafA/YrhL, contains acyltransferase and SGNH-hydrolase domains [Epilithonimonas bovis DSM 19482]|uniref:Peptidoglycan/LPS O-acetylase OafA/YrhL, contains acyltransferase and SGNH-hydrolase domains n=1 Tax=Epilithonimonas bovis DSM 19482 TaxID=1121284 RepID=A0A1U7PTF3_9FLAO|nr:acyltransferase [Epilithonimonas bovis]SIT96199.1 Peptidoglycan/LPS O-acetylase OafA/YrhL, contains acyltransferase and SGNH-hydrolase domains [Epilithonimonas bovis DSM 19482]
MRIKELDVFRGFAALAVVLYHYTTMYNKMCNVSSSWELPYGWLGVPVFFILSGFVIYLTVDKSKSAIDFLKKRFIRLYPTYWLCLLITLCIEYFSGMFLADLTWKDILMNFTMFQQFFNLRHVDGAYWSLLPELLFYGLMAFLMKIKKVRSYYLYNAILLIIGIIHLVFPLPIIGKILSIHYILLFMIGIAFYRIYNKMNTKWDYVFIIFNYIVGTKLYFNAQEHHSISNVFSYFSLALIICLYYLFVKGCFSFLAKFRVLIFFGNISYALYLIHQNIGYIIINNLEDFTGRNMAMFIALGISVILASLITFQVEPRIKPIVKKLLYNNNN